MTLAGSMRLNVWALIALGSATFPMGIARSTTCEQELIGFQSMVRGGGYRKRPFFETPGK
jgi:hypothetical protein